MLNIGLTFTLKAGGNVAGGATIKISVSNRYTFVSGNGCFFTDISDVVSNNMSLVFINPI